MPRDVAQRLITALDLGHMTPKAAKDFCAKSYRLKITGRTRDDVARAIGRAIIA